MKPKSFFWEQVQNSLSICCFMSLFRIFLYFSPPNPSYTSQGKCSSRYRGSGGERYAKLSTRQFLVNKETLLFHFRVCICSSSGVAFSSHSNIAQMLYSKFPFLQSSHHCFLSTEWLTVALNSLCMLSQFCEQTCSHVSLTSSLLHFYCHWH